MRDPRYDILFEPVKIGPVTARNRFYQVPHCNGMGYSHPQSMAEMRGVKAEGGWAVVCTEETEIHPTSDMSPYVELRNWDNSDIRTLALMAEKVHEHGSLAGIELVHTGMHSPNYFSREAPIGPAHLPIDSYAPVQARRMDLSDIAELRRWHRHAIDRSLKAGFDIVYVYAGHMMTLLQHFLSRRYNDRTDAYGGSLENRARLLREVLEDALEQVDGTAAVACRLCVDELIGPAGLERAEIEELFGMLAEHPDLWDLQVGTWDYDSSTSRFEQEGYQEDYLRGLKQLTTKPVVGVGRFTSPDEMVRQIRTGILDLVGAARPSIADPFLPKKIEEGRPEDIRECIGCNICVTGDSLISPSRCTQNPSFSEEWRRGWHPERIPKKRAEGKVLVVGAGPAGLEAAQSAGKRGYEVVVVEATRDLGGRVARESRLPGLAVWSRVVEYRLGQIEQLTNVEIYRESEMTADDTLAYGFDHVCVATGSMWRADGVGRVHTRPLQIDDGIDVLSPDHLMDGRLPEGERVIVFDDDHYYMGGVLAELLAEAGKQVELVTPAAIVSAWTEHTMETRRIHRRLSDLGVTISVHGAVTEVGSGSVVVQDQLVGGEKNISCDAVVFVTARLPNEQLYRSLLDRKDEWEAAGLRSVRAVGDCWAPSTIASAVWWGRRFAEELDETPSEPAFQRELSL